MTGLIIKKTVATEGRMKFRVRELAQERELTAEELARRADIKYSALKNIWQGRTGNPKYLTVRAIARALGVSVEELESGNKTPADALT
jgi:transcriptional regulator with XRE-family HTH domain